MERILLSRERAAELRYRFDRGGKLQPEDVRALFDTLEQTQQWLDTTPVRLHSHVVAVLKDGAFVGIHGAHGRYHACIDGEDAAYFIPVAELPIHLIGVAVAQKIEEELKASGRSQLEELLYPWVKR